MVLCDYGHTTIVSDDGDRRQLRFAHTTRIKILTSAGLDWGTVEVRLAQDPGNRTERLTDVRGFTYNLVQGKVQRQALDASNIFSNKVSEFTAVAKFALPNVRAGSVIEFSYSVLSDYVFYFHDWQFQRSIPTRWSEYRADIPHQFFYKIFLQSKQPLAVDEKRGLDGLTPHYRWAMRDVPALRPEPYMTTPADYVDELTFELARYRGTDVAQSWDKIDELLLRDPNLGQLLDQNNYLKPDLDRALAGLPADDAAARAAAVRALVLQAVRCTGERRLRASRPLRTTWQDTHRGTVADVNFLLIAALREAGLAANPVLLSTRDHGQVRTAIPLLSQFNYVAAHVPLPDGTDLVLDATDPTLPYDLLPAACLNQRARLVTSRPATSRWLDVRPRHRALHLQQVQLRLSPTGSYAGQVHAEYAGYAAAEARTDLLRLGEAKFAGQLAREHPALTLSAFSLANADTPDKSLGVNYECQSAEAEADGPRSPIYFSPLRLFGLARNPLRREQRTFPVDFGYAQEDILVLTLTLPEGYALAEVPKAQVLNLPDGGGRYLCSTTATGRTVQLTSRLTLAKPVYSVAEYAGLRQLYDLVLSKQAEKLIIRKNTNN